MKDSLVYDESVIAALRQCNDLERIQKIAQKWKIEIMRHNALTKAMEPRNKQKLLRDLAALRWAQDQPQVEERGIARRSVHDLDRDEDLPAAGPSRQTTPHAGTVEEREPGRPRASVPLQSTSSSRPTSTPRPGPSSFRPAQSAPQDSSGLQDTCILRHGTSQAGGPTVRREQDEMPKSTSRGMEHAPQRRSGPSNVRPPSPPAQRPTTSRDTATPVRSRPPLPTSFRTPQNAPSTAAAVPRAGPSTVPQHRPGYLGASRPSPQQAPGSPPRSVGLPLPSAGHQTPLSAGSYVAPTAGPSTVPQRHILPSGASRGDSIRSPLSLKGGTEREHPRASASRLTPASQQTTPLTSTPNAGPSSATLGSQRQSLPSRAGERNAKSSTTGDGDPSESRPAGTSTARSSGSEGSTRKRPRDSQDNADDDSESSGSEGKKKRLAASIPTPRVDKGKGRARDDTAVPSPHSSRDIYGVAAGDSSRSGTQQRRASPHRVIPDNSSLRPAPPTTSREAHVDNAGRITSPTPPLANSSVDPEGSRALHTRSPTHSLPGKTPARRGPRPAAPPAVSLQELYEQGIRLSSQPITFRPFAGSQSSDPERDMRFIEELEPPSYPFIPLRTELWRRLFEGTWEPEASTSAEKMGSAPEGEADAEEAEDGAQVQDEIDEVDEGFSDHGPTPAQRQRAMPLTPTPLPIDPERQRRHDDAEAMLRVDAHGMVEALLPFFRNRGFLVHRTALMERMRALWTDLAPPHIQYDLRTPEPGEPPIPTPIGSETEGPTASEIVERALSDEYDLRSPLPTPPDGGFASGTRGVYRERPWTPTPEPLPDSSPPSATAPAVVLDEPEAVQSSPPESGAQPSGSGRRDDSPTSGSQQRSDGSARVKRRRGSDSDDDGGSSSSGSKKKRSDSPESPPRKLDKGKARAW